MLSPSARENAHEQSPHSSNTFTYIRNTERTKEGADQFILLRFVQLQPLLSFEHRGLPDLEQLVFFFILLRDYNQP